MSLSNTATPIYYGRFREAVMRGEIPINREIEMEMHRIDDLIANPEVYYEQTEAILLFWTLSSFGVNRSSAGITLSSAPYLSQMTEAEADTSRDTSRSVL